jgi:phosphatidylserine/phosphatidylglycerophosphate/cardiolipin synthase-like enzyme
MKISDLDIYSVKGFPDGWSDTERVFFSPVDRVHDVLKTVINSATHRISVNMYGYDDNEIDAILRAKAISPEIAFVMNLDKSQAGGIHEKVLLAEWATAIGSSVAVGESVKRAISHLKVCVVDGLYVISGSTNWSLSGESKQDNELTISRDPLKAARFESIILANHLEMLKQMGGVNLVEQVKNA